MNRCNCEPVVDLNLELRVLGGWQVPFYGGQAEFKLIDAVAEDLQLGLVGKAAFGGAAQAG